MSKKSKKKPKVLVPSGEFTPHVSHPLEQAALDRLFPLKDATSTPGQDAEVAAQWAHRTRTDYRIVDPANIAADLIVEEQPSQLGESVVTSGKDVPTSSTPPTTDVVWKKDGDTDWRIVHDSTDPAEAAMVRDALTKSALNVPGTTLNSDDAPEVRSVVWKAGYTTRWSAGLRTQPPSPTPGLPEPKLGPIGLEPAVDPVLQNGNGQAMIHFLDASGKEKVKGYTRVTTYIDGLDDKTVLNKWKQRTLLEGAALDWQQDADAQIGDGGSVAAVGRAVKRLDIALADIDRREAIDGELLELRRQELLKEHRDFLEAIGENLMDLGGAHDKATKGTNLHRLTELVDQGLPLPADTTASDRRDVAAYQAKVAELGLEVLWTEKRVVLDDIQVSGTMDRAYLYKRKGAQRRIRVVGDLKTGSVSWGYGKIGQQLCIYARGLGYDHAKPLERESLRLSKSVGLLIHLPQGEGVCNVFEVDLELAAQGVDLSRQVREWRNTQKRLYDLKSPVVAESKP